LISKYKAARLYWPRLGVYTGTTVQRARQCRHTIWLPTRRSLYGIRRLGSCRCGPVPVTNDVGGHLTCSCVLAVFGAVLLACTPIFSGAVMKAYPLHIAAGNDDVAAIRQLLSGGTEIDARDSSGATALLVATRANKVRAAQTLIAAGADVNA